MLQLHVYTCFSLLSRNEEKDTCSNQVSIVEQTINNIEQTICKQQQYEVVVTTNTPEKHPYMLLDSDSVSCIGFFVRNEF